MVSTRRRISLIAGVAAVAALLALPSLASANVYCVDVSGGDCTDIEPAGALQQALNDANAHAGPDTVRLGPTSYPTTAPAGFVYSSANAPVSIIGSGQGATTIAVQAPASPPVSSTQFSGLNIFGTGATGSSVSALTVTLPVPADAANTNQQYRGIQMSNGTIADVAVIGPAANATNAFGIGLDAGTVQDSTVTLPRLGFPTNIGVANFNNSSSNLSIVASTITADTAIRYSNTGTGSATVSRSVLLPSIFGVVAGVATIVVEDTIIDLGSFNGATGISTGFDNPLAHTSTSTVDGVTIAGSGTGATGIRVFADDLNSPATPGDTASATVRNSILDQSLDVPIRREADNNGAANVVTEYSNYDPTGNDESNGGTGTGQITQTNQTNLSPMFVGGGDFHLLASSPLIDIGDPAPPALGALDFEGDPRSLDGTTDCVLAPRRDIGADEFVNSTPVIDCPPPPGTAAPETFVFGKRKVKTRKKKARVSWTFTASEPSTFQCSLDGAPFAPCTSPFTRKVRRGAHTLSVRATDAAGNADPTPASFTTKVKRKRVRR